MIFALQARIGGTWVLQIILIKNIVCTCPTPFAQRLAPARFTNFMFLPTVARHCPHS